MQELVEKISNNLEQARLLIDEALTIGRDNGISVELTKLGITEDMWYVDETEYRQQYIKDNYRQWNFETCEYELRELTGEELKEVEDHMQSLRDNGGYDGYGYKAIGWKSSSTNCEGRKE